MKQKRFKKFVILLFGLIVIAAICWMVLDWGYNQHLTVAYVEKHVTLGMTIGEAEEALGLPKGMIAKREEKEEHPTPKLKRSFTISEAGVGAYFEEQYSIVLFTNHEGVITDAYAESVRGIDDQGVLITLKAKQKQ
ncbi:MAG: hypothetical protein WCO51_03335 [bacterium]